MEEVLAGRYALGAELGRGGMARVVAARDLRLQRDVAVKLLLPGGVSSADPAARRRFVREARSAASFAHPHTVAVFDPARRPACSTSSWSSSTAARWTP